mgnify:CR=1 FL=1|jgi:NTE family protein
MVYSRLVLSGGAVKGIAYIGVLKYFEENKDTFRYFDEFVGTSIGAMMCLLIVLNYSSKQLKKIFWDFDFNSVKNTSISILVEKFGLDNGELLENMLKKFIRNKGLDENISFKNLYLITGKSLVICVSNVNKKATRYFDKNFDPDMPVYLAVRISMNLPLIFTPVEYQGHLYIDGGLTNDIPVNYPNVSNKETICICLNSIENEESSLVSLESYFYNVFKLAFKVISEASKKFARENGIILIEIKSAIRLSLDFSLTLDQRELLYTSGYDRVKEIFNKLNKNGANK